MEYAAYHFELAVPQADGLTLREHLESWEKNTKREHEKLSNGPELPWEVEPLWRQFMELHRSRGINRSGTGPGEIDFTLIDAWMRVRDIKLEQWEVDTILLADLEYFKALPKPKKPSEGNGK